MQRKQNSSSNSKLSSCLAGTGDLREQVPDFLASCGVTGLVPLGAATAAVLCCPSVPQLLWGSSSSDAKSEGCIALSEKYHCQR